MNLWIFGAVLLLAGATSGYNILVLTPLNGKSHWLFMQSIIKAILNRNHEVTVITSKTWDGVKPANYTEVLVDPPIDLELVLPQSQVFAAEDGGLFNNFVMLPMLGKLTADHCLNSTNVQKFLHDESLSFDLVINEEFYMESFSMFAHRFKAPLITISAYGYSDFFDRQFGHLTPWSHVPHTFLTYSDEMTFLERLHNTVISLADCAVRRFLHVPLQNEIAQKYFGYLGDLPSIDELMKNVSAILINTHRSVLPARPSMPGIAFIGGAHIKEPKALPTDLQAFLDGAEDGAIYFSFGTYVRSTEMQPERLKMILDALGQVKQRVLWKYDDESIQNVPSNVMIRKWMPQNDILAHKNVALFISHGGMFGHLESLYRGVPLIMIPFFGDQFRNAKRAQLNGYAKHIDFKTLNAETLVNAIREMTTNKSYLNKAREISAIFKDNLVHPMDEAIFWIEHIAKFRGAKHLKSHAANMNWFHYLLIDVFAALTLIPLVLLFVLYIAIRKCLGGKSKDSKQSKKRKMN